MSDRVYPYCIFPKTTRPALSWDQAPLSFCLVNRFPKGIEKCLNCYGITCVLTNRANVFRCASEIWIHVITSGIRWTLNSTPRPSGLTIHTGWKKTGMPRMWTDFANFNNLAIQFKKARRSSPPRIHLRVKSLVAAIVKFCPLDPMPSTLVSKCEDLLLSSSHKNLQQLIAVRAFFWHLERVSSFFTVKETRSRCHL